MTDSIANIRAMLEAVRAERKQIDDRLVLLEEREEKLVEWLREEEPRQRVLLAPADKEAVSPLTKMVLETLSDGKSRDTGQIAYVAVERGLVSRKGSPLRAINALMQGMRQKNLVKRTSDGGWLKK